MLDTLFKPNDPRSHEQKIPPIQIGIILNIDDPEKLGRVQVSCPMFDENTPLPNGNDGWIQMVNLSSGGGSPGGTQSLIHQGDQVIVAAINGDLRSTVCLGVLHSTIDLPSPHFDRANGVYGVHSPNGRVEVYDETERRSVKVEQGNAEFIDRQGNRIIEAPGGTKLILGANGEARMENQRGAFSVDQDGAMTATNGMATFGINSDGEVDISLNETPSVKLTPFSTYVTGQKDQVSRNLEDVKNNAYPFLGKSVIWQSQLLAMADDIESAPDAETALSLLYQIDEILEEVVRGVQGLSFAIPALRQLQSAKVLDLGSRILGQIDNFRDRNFTQVVSRFSAGLNDTQIENIETELAEIIDAKLLQGIDFDRLKKTLRSVFDPDLQVKALLERFSPLGEIDSVITSELFKSTERLNAMTRRLDELNLEEQLTAIDTFGSDAASQLQSVQNQIAAVANIVPPISATASKALVAKLKSVTAVLRSAKDRLKENLSSAKGHLDQITQLKNNLDLELEFGGIVADGIKELLSCVENIAPVTTKAIALEELTTILLELNGIDEQEEVHRLTTLIPQITSFLNTKEYTNLTLEPDGTILIEDAIASIDALTYDIGKEVIPEALRNLVGEFAAEASIGFTALQFLDNNLSSQSTSGGMVLDDEGTVSNADSGNTGGNVIQDKNCAALMGPGANHGLGAKVVAEKERAVMAAAGADVGLSGIVDANPLGVTIKTPGADLDLGVLFDLGQEKTTLFAPGGQSGIGSVFEFDQDAIGL